ncbi:MAG: serine hydrolase domain-containing protein, partial [Bacteroidota bacterium]
MINRFFILAIALVCLISCENQTVESNATAEITPTVFDTLNADLSSYDSLNILPGFAVSIFKADTILFEKGYGYSNIEEKSPYTPESIQIIASATKTLVGVSLMKAVENGSLKLDDNINNYLPSSVINPNYPDEVITPRMLASHTSSISDV